MYILCYVDDILVVYHSDRPALDRIDHFMIPKEGFIGDPDIYLGAKSEKVQISNDVWCWSIIPSKYIQEAVWNFQNHLKKNHSGEYEWIANTPNPFLLDYKPEMDVYPLNLPDEAYYYQPIIGVMKRMV